jgi:hypothetical protein
MGLDASARSAPAGARLAPPAARMGATDTSTLFATRFMRAAKRVAANGAPRFAPQGRLP